MAKYMLKIADVSIFGHFYAPYRGNIFLQQFPATFPARFSCKIFPQHFPTTISHNTSCKIFPQDFPTTIFCNISHKIFFQDFSTRISRKFFLQDFPKLDPDWLAPHHPILTAKFPPITPFLKLAFSPSPCPARFFRARS